ncbi:hypothetical protein RhiirA4_475176 [Rhizophagus irregularis]|uniref:Uncharacterized protein n=1 Tax=Rhizophagus irregularis TaxID=588596 RepID=A0A2I1H9Q4_9GLOM|nr:hypothetical protein RhiirA4_475176 [Rhizophagus irregularis]
MCYSPFKRQKTNETDCFSLKGISYTKQLAFEGRKSYKQPSAKCKKLVNYRVIYRNYNEADLTSGTKKVELFTKRRIRGLKSNMEKCKFLNNSEVIINFQLSHHIWKPIAAILTKQYIKSSNLALLYSEAL